MMAPGAQGHARGRPAPRYDLADYLALRERFGDVVCLTASPRPAYLVSHPDAVQYILRDHADNYRKGELFEPIAALQGQGLLTSAGNLWRHQRRLMQAAFQPRQIASCSDPMVREAQALVHGWRQAARSGRPVNVTAWMHRLTFRVVAQMLLGMTADDLDETALQIQAIAAPLMQAFSSPGQDGRTGPCTWQKQPFRRAVVTYNTIVQQLVDTRRQALRSGDLPATDLLAQLIAAHDDPNDTYMTAQQLRDEVITLIGAGSETSALALSWACDLLAQHPEALRQTQTELDAVLGGRLPTPPDLPQLPYSRMVLDEALRLYPPSAVLPRQANANDVVGGYAIAKDAIVIMSPYVTHRHADFWPRPEQFQPQRFSPEGVAKRHRFAYFPFGAGARTCIGKPFALMEMHLVLATVAQVYTLQAVPGRPVVPILDTTLRPRDGLWMTVHERR